MSTDMFAVLFNEMHPDFFAPANTAHMPRNMIYEEQVMYNPAAFSTGRAAAETDCGLLLQDITVPVGTTFGFYSGDHGSLLSAVAAVDQTWPQYFTADERIYCAMREGRIASFCMLSDMGIHHIGGTTLRVAGPSCVGTVPEFRRQSIGLKMVQNVTRLIFEEGYDLSYIHYTGVGRWYERLGYKTVLRWNWNGMYS